MTGEGGKRMFAEAQRVRAQVVQVRSGHGVREGRKGMGSKCGRRGGEDQGRGQARYWRGRACGRRWRPHTLTHFRTPEKPLPHT